jgi:hypothetical protein
VGCVITNLTFLRNGVFLLCVVFFFAIN